MYSIPLLSKNLSRKTVFKYKNQEKREEKRVDLLFSRLLSEKNAHGSATQQSKEVTASTPAWHTEHRWATDQFYWHGLRGAQAPKPPERGKQGQDAKWKRGELDQVLPWDPGSLQLVPPALHSQRQLQGLLHAAPSPLLWQGAGRAARKTPAGPQSSSSVKSPLNKFCTDRAANKVISISLYIWLDRQGLADV